METITVQISAADKAMLKRIAASVDRRFDDLNQLIFGSGLDYFFAEEQVYVKKLPQEFTPEEKEQLTKNEQIDNDPKIRGWEAREEAGYKLVTRVLSNCETKPSGQGHYDPLIEPMAERIKAFATS